jgi:hypothetical protein
MMAGTLLIAIVPLIIMAIAVIRGIFMLCFVVTYTTIFIAIFPASAIGIIGAVRIVYNGLVMAVLVGLSRENASTEGGERYR